MVSQKTTATLNGNDVTATDVVVDRMVDGQAVETWVYFENDQLLEA